MLLSRIPFTWTRFLTRSDEPVPLRRWLWKSYLLSAIVPLLLVELTFLAIYWGSNALAYRKNVEAVTSISRKFLDDIVVREAQAMSHQLKTVERATELFARQTLRSLRGNHQPPGIEKARYARTPDGAFYTKSDNGTTAGYYSGIVPIGPKEESKVFKLSSLDPVMIDIKRTYPAVTSIYFNTYDTYNKIYPYIDTKKYIESKTDVRKYNFYFEADSKHNPGRKPVWTDTYLDPAGHGWMVSSLAPVWNKDRLEGVVGLDVTVQSMVDKLRALGLPWNAYALLIDRKGRILAMPPQAEADFRLKELTTNNYSGTVKADTFKPDTFDLGNRSDTRALAQAMRRAPSGHALLNLASGVHQANFATISGPEWRLVIIAPSAAIRKEADDLQARSQKIGYMMAAGLVVFYAIFLAVLYRRARIMSARIAAPVDTIGQLISRIGNGDYRQTFAGSEVRELNELGEQLVLTGRQLGDAYERILAQDRVVTEALLRQSQVNEEHVRFIRMMSHEVRTPLSIIDSGAQIVSRKAEEIDPGALRDRMAKMRKSVQRISGLLHKLVDLAAMDTKDAGTDAVVASLPALVAEAAETMVTPARLRLVEPGVGTSGLMTPHGDAISFALRAALSNAMLYSEANSPIEVRLERGEDRAVIEVTDCGKGIPPDEVEMIGQRYFRGSSSEGTQGAGISLHLARKLLGRIGGDIAIESRAGKTRLQIFVPMPDKDVRQV